MMLFIYYLFHKTALLYLQKITFIFEGSRMCEEIEMWEAKAYFLFKCLYLLYKVSFLFHRCFLYIII